MITLFITRRRLVDRTKRTLLPYLRRLPAERGPQRLRVRVRAARMDHIRALIRRRPGQALDLIHSELAQDPSNTALLRMAALAASRSGFLDLAANYDRQAMEGGYASVGDLLRLRKYALGHKDMDTAVRATELISHLAPRNAQEVKRVAQALRRYPAGTLRAVAQRSAEKYPGLDLDALYRHADENELVAALRDNSSSGTDSASVLVRQLLDRGGSHDQILIRALGRGRGWALLSAVSQEMSPESQDRVSLSTWRHVADRARVAGWSDVSARLARIILDKDPQDERARRWIGEGADVTHVLTHGWQYPPRRAAYDGARRDAALEVLGQSLPLRSGGYATRSHGILTSLRDRGWDMTAVTRLGFPFDLWWSADDPREPRPIDVIDGIPYHRLLLDGVRDYPRTPLAPYIETCAQGIASLAQQQGAGLIHASSLYDVGMAGLTAARRLGVPFVYEMRGLKQLLEEARDPQFAVSSQDAYLDVLESSVAREADAVLVITDALGQRMVDMGVDGDKITVVPNGVHVDRFVPRPRDKALEAELGVRDKCVIGYAGGLVHYEGLDLLFAAVAMLLAEGRAQAEFHVLIVGDGAHERTLRKVVEELGISSVVTFTGRVPHEEVERYLSLVDITPFPRAPMPVCELISPIKPFEAMAMAKAVVVSDVAALTEIVTEGRTGRAFAKGDSTALAQVLAELLDDPEQRQRLGAEAREWVRAERDWYNITASVDQVYRQLLG